MIAHRYKILEEIGSGGIGKVFKALDRFSNQQVAVKVLSLLEPEHVERFKREYLLLRKLSHPHIVPVYDFGFSEKAEPYFVMEYIDGKEWKTFLRPWDESKFWPLILSIVETIDFLHAKEIIHGDIKPSNILISSSPQDQLIPKFTDFGFAEMGKLDESSWWKGTLSYLAPEIIRGEKHSHQADLYSLGVLIYESIFGNTPFEEQELAELAKSHLEKEVLIPQEPSIPEGLKNLTLKLLEKDPMDRYYSAAEVLTDLNKISGLKTFDTESSLATSLIYTTDFVGRENLLFTLKEAFGHLSNNTGNVILLSGESGIGKTRLLDEFSDWAKIEGASVLNLKLEQGEPFESHQEEIFHLLQDQSRPGLLILEHLERLDDSSLDSLLRLIQQSMEKKLLVCLSLSRDFTRSRRDLKASQIEELLKSIFQENLKILKLKELTQEEAESLVISSFSWKGKKSAIATAVFEKTHGNPQLIRHLFEWSIENQHIRRQDNEWSVELEKIKEAKAPAALFENITGRLDRLSKDELSILELASVLGGEFEMNALNALSGVDSDVFQRCISNIFAERILLPLPNSSDNSRIRFLNGFTKDILYKQLDRDKVKGFHLAVAKQLESLSSSGQEADVDQLADHYYRAGDNQPALKYSLIAAQKADDLGKADRAILHYLRALQLWDDCSSPPLINKDETYLRLAQQYEANGLYDESLRYYQKSLELIKHKSEKVSNVLLIYQRMARIHNKIGWQKEAARWLEEALLLVNPDERPEEYASVLSELGQQKITCCEYNQAISCLEKVIKILHHKEPSKETGKCLYRLASVYWALGDLSKALHHLSESLVVYQKSGNTKEVAGCYIAEGILLRTKGLPEEALAASQKAIALMENISDPNRLSTLYTNLGCLLIDLNSWDKALEYLNKSQEIKEQLFDQQGLAHSHNNIGLIFLKKGLFDRSSEQFILALHLFQRIRDRSGAALIYQNLADLNRCKEEYDKALHYLDKAMKMAKQIGGESRLANCLLLLGRIHLEQFKLNQAGESLNQAMELFIKGENQMGKTEAHLGLTELYILAGDLEQAAEHSRNVRSYTDASGNKWFEGLLDRISAELLKCKGDSDGCLKLLLHAAATFKSMGARYELGRTYLKLGRFKLETGRLNEARAFLNEALSIFEKTKIEGGRKEAMTLLEQTKGASQLEKERIRTFYRLADILNSVWDTDELLTKALELVIELMNAERGAITLYSEKDKYFEVKVSFGLEPETSKDAVTISRRVLSDVIEKDAPLIVDDAVNDPLFAKNKSVVMYNILSILCVPLKTMDRLIGTVYLDHRSLPAVFSSEDVDFLKAFASLIATAIEKSELYVKAHEEIFQLKEALHQYYEYPGIVGKSSKMQEIFNLVEKVANSKTSVLVLGESGTGKELIAHLIHERSQRIKGPFVRVNCAALAESILESELFGIEEKAATGVAFRKGKFEQADGGTIFLDEIGDMSLSVQAKVLRVLQEKEFERVGGQKSIKVDIRIVSATNQDLQKKVEQGTFRLDLFYRLNTIIVNIPPLRERKEDIPLLADYFAQRASEENNKPKVKLTKRIIAALQDGNWENNVRELKNLIERATLLSEKGEFPRRLVEEFRKEPENADSERPGKLQDILNWVEKKRILQALERNRWNQVKAADELGLNETTLRRKMKKYKLRKPRHI